MKKDKKIFVSTTEHCSSLCVAATYNGGSEGEIIWRLTNGTDAVKYVALVRGATLQINGQEVSIPAYLFGRAFPEVYFNEGMSVFGTKDSSFANLYTLAVYNDETIGFVFALPPQTTVSVPEYGFINLVKYDAKLVPVELGEDKLFVDIYNYSEVIEYESEIGQNLGYLPDPIAFKSMVVTAPRSELGYSFHERVLLPIPYQWLETADTVARAIEKLKQLF